MKRFFFGAGFSSLAVIIIAELLPKFEFVLHLRIFLLIFGLICIGTAVLFKDNEKLNIFKILAVCLIAPTIVLSVWINKKSDFFEDYEKYKNYTFENVELVLVEMPALSTNGVYKYIFNFADSDISKHRLMVYSHKNVEMDVFDSIIIEKLTIKSSEDDIVYFERNKQNNIFLSTFNNFPNIKIKENKKPVLYIFTQIQHHIAQTFEKYMPNDETLPFAFLTGRKDYFDEFQYTDFVRAGLLHTVAVSGMHVSIFVMFILFLLVKIKNKTVRFIIIFLTLFFLMGIAGFTASIVRAAIMVTFVMLGEIIGRKADSVNNLGLALFLLLLFDPFSALSPSLLLSFFAVLGIVLIGKPLQNITINPINKKFPGAKITDLEPIYSIFFTSIAASLFTLPISVIYFGGYSSVFLITNILCLPIVEVSYILSLLMVVFEKIPIISMLNPFLAIPNKLGVHYILIVANVFADLNYSLIDISLELLVLSVVLGVCSFLLTLIEPKESRSSKKTKKTRSKKFNYQKIVLPIIVVFATLIIGSVTKLNVWLPDDELMTVTFIDVGQGCSAVVIHENKVAVVDCGGNKKPGQNVEEYLRKRNLNEIEYVILTHLHDDHTNGLTYLCEKYKIKQIIIPNTEGDPAILVEITMLAAYNDIELTVLSEDEMLKLNDVELSILTKHLNPSSKDQNENSLIIIAKMGGFSAMFTGDITSASEKRVLKEYENIKCTVLGIAHHGSKYSSSLEFLEAVKPKYSVISVGNNSYGHPTTEAIERIAKFSDYTYQTIKNGNIEFRTNGVDLDILTDIAS